MSKLLQKLVSTHRKESRLGDLSERIGDGLHGTPHYDSEGAFPFINGNNLNNGYVSIKSDTRKVDEAEYEKYKKDLHEGTLLISINGTIGNLAKYRNEKCVLGKSICYVNPKKEISSDYLYYAMLDRKFQNHILMNANGSTIKNVSLGQMRDYVFSIPDYETQNTIAQILGTYDAKIENNNFIIKNLESTAETIFNEWFVKFRFPRYEEVNFVESDMGDIPEHWSVKKVKDVADLNKGVSYTSKEINTEYEGVALINLGNFRRGGGFNPDGTKYFTGAYKESHSVKPGQILIAMTDLTSNREVIGHPARLPEDFNEAVISLDVCSLSPKKGTYIEFLYYSMLNRNFSKLMASCASGTNVSHLSKTHIEEYDFAFPNDDLLIQFNNLIQPIITQQSILDKENVMLKQSRDRLTAKLI